MTGRSIRTATFFLIITTLVSGCGAHVYHQVRKGDTLYSISFRYHQDYREVARWNNIPEPYVISQGQWLRIAAPAESQELSAPPEYRSTPKPAVISSRRSTPTVSPKQKTAVNTSAPSVASASQSKSTTIARGSEASVSQSRESISWQWPVNGVVISNYKANTIGRQGIDFAGSRGSTVNAAASGKVVYSGNALRGYGNLVIIKHNDKYLSAYGHNDTLLVKEGDAVKRGEAIARMGSSGTDRVKLHFQIRVDGKPVNPTRYLPKRGS